MSRIVITGATGVVGSAVLSAARDRGQSVVALSRRTSPGMHAIDIHDPDSIAPHLRGADAVVHAAGLAHVFGASADDAVAFARANADSVAAVVLAAGRAAVPHVILLSSVSVYGGSEARGVDESFACTPVGPYAESKLAGERRAADLTRDQGTSLTTLRLATVYGEGDRGNVARLMRAIDARRFVWIGRGRNRKSLIHRDDVSAAVLGVVARGRAGEGTFNVSAEPVLMHEVVDGLARALQRRILPVHLPAALARSGAALARRAGFESAAGAVRKWMADDFYRAD